MKTKSVRLARVNKMQTNMRKHIYVFNNSVDFQMFGNHYLMHTRHKSVSRMATLKLLKHCLYRQYSFPFHTERVVKNGFLKIISSKVFCTKPSKKRVNKVRRTLWS